MPALHVQCCLPVIIIRGINGVSCRLSVSHWQPPPCTPAHLSAVSVSPSCPTRSTASCQRCASSGAESWEASACCQACAEGRAQAACQAVRVCTCI